MKMILVIIVLTHKYFKELKMVLVNYVIVIQFKQTEEPVEVSK